MPQPDGRLAHDLYRPARARFKLGAGDLMCSTVAQAFVNAFVAGSLGTLSDALGT